MDALSKEADVREAAGEFLRIVRANQPAAVLTGAGVSVASGIPDFRSSGGLYSKISPRTFDLDRFHARPMDYYRVAVEHIHPLIHHEPSACHVLLAAMERAGLIEGVITQNIDRLHQKAGSRNVLEFHGNAETFACTRCRAACPRERVEEAVAADTTPLCAACGGVIKPDIVFFGDPIDGRVFAASEELCRRARCLIAMGSSLTVHPAAGLCRLALATEPPAELLIVNITATPYDRLAAACYRRDLETFSRAVLEILGES